MAAMSLIPCPDPEYPWILPQFRDRILEGAILDRDDGLCYVRPDNKSYLCYPVYGWDAINGKWISGGIRVPGSKEESFRDWWRSAPASLPQGA
ncbi:MAG: hypothetical protein ACYDHX_07770 [Methanothrix sp.]